MEYTRPRLRVVELSHVPEPSANTRIGSGEAVLLAYSPIFKVRYASDGDLYMGCAVGCKFCYYRMIKSTAPFIGTGKLVKLASPEEFVDMIEGSKLLSLHPLVILGARGDASMYPAGVRRVLEIAEERGLRKVFLALRRPPFDREVADQLLSYPRMLRYGTTLTPKARETGTPVTEESQLEGLAKVVDAGVRPEQISVEVGPITPSNIDKVPFILRGLADMGFKAAIYRGVSAGSYDLPRREVLDRLHRMGFLPDDLYRRALKSKDYFYGVKNELLPWMEDAIKGVFEEAGLKAYRHTGLFYALEWGIPVALSRRNRVRTDVYGAVQNRGSPKEVEKLLLDLGYTVTGVEQLASGVYRVFTREVVTEDVAMTVGAVTGTAVIASRYVRSPTLRELEFYIDNRIIVPPRRNLDHIERFLGRRSGRERVHT